MTAAMTNTVIVDGIASAANMVIYPHQPILAGRTQNARPCTYSLIQMSGAWGV